MNYEEAKAYFEMRLTDSHSKGRTRQREAFKIAIEAITARIPWTVNGDYNCFSCPDCGQEYECTPLRPKCCDNCGQAFDLSNIPDWEEIDWSMEEEGEE